MVRAPGGFLALFLGVQCLAAYENLLAINGGRPRAQHQEVVKSLENFIR